jgi:Kinesin motor domain
VVVPYRDSNLTKLLWEGLRGTGRALMIACVGPLRTQVEETMNTLHFASTALRIKAEPVVLLDPLVSLGEPGEQGASLILHLSTGFT